jgi:dihydropyrimidine dehydrogenase (NAD+) subunit PreT
VTMVYRRTEAEKPCTQVELDIAKLDGCEIIWLAAPKEIIGANGKVTRLVCSIMKLGEPDSSGRRAPIDTGETFSLDVDMVIKAAGQVPFEELINTNGIANKNGKIVIDSNCSTNIKGVFAGGDAVNGGKEVVDAAQAGKDGAAAILRYLKLS